MPSWHMFRWLLTQRREFRARVEREASELLSSPDAHAYNEARWRMRAARSRGDRGDARLWAKVAVEVADRTGHEIGVKGADRYPPPPPRFSV